MAHPATDAHGHVHSHRSLYIKTGVILTVLTAIEVGVLVEPFKSMIPQELFAPSLVIMSIVKFAMVIGIFMHLRDDRGVYRLLFLAPMVLAVLSFITLGILAVVHYAPFGKGYAVTAYDKRAGFVEPTVGGAAAEPAWPQEKLQEAYVAAEQEQFAAGKEVFTANCASCHGAQGGGVPALGPNLTDLCYIHGGELSDLYKTIAQGVPSASPPMPAWNGVLKPEQIRAVTYYVRSLRGANVPGGRECQGEQIAQ